MHLFMPPAKFEVRFGLQRRCHYSQYHIQEGKTAPDLDKTFETFLFCDVKFSSFVKKELIWIWIEVKEVGLVGTTLEWILVKLSWQPKYFAFVFHSDNFRI